VSRQGELQMIRKMTALGIGGLVVGGLLAGWALAAETSSAMPVPRVIHNPFAEEGSSAEGSSENAGNALPESVIRDMRQSDWITPPDGSRHHFTIAAGRSKVLRLKSNVRRVSISDPEVVDIMLLSSKEILLNAKKNGAVNLIFWNQLNEISIFDITVVRDIELLQSMLWQIAPKTAFEIYPSEDVFVIKGEVDTVEKQEAIEKAANAFAEGSVSLVEVHDARQILLETRFVQVDLSHDFDFGMDFEFNRDQPNNNILTRFLPGATNAATSGDSTGTFPTPANTFDMFDRNDDDVFQLGYFQNKRVILGFLKALEGKGISKTIARPNLLTRDGEEASFLVGGEAAVVVATGNELEVDYREFGTRLTFTPKILRNGKISLTIEPEVSLLSAANGITVDNTQVPGFSTTRIKTVVELYPDETFMIGGLIQQQLITTESGVPFLKRIPMIGKLFSSTEQNWDETELLVIITPRLVDSEKGLVPADSSEHDSLAQATAFDDSPLDTKQGTAIKAYVKDGIRNPSEAQEISAKQDKLIQDLDALDAELQWE